MKPMTRRSLGLVLAAHIFEGRIKGAAAVAVEPLRKCRLEGRMALFVLEFMIGLWLMVNVRSMVTPNAENDLG